MLAVILASLGVGGATVLGALGGFLFNNTIYKHSNPVNAFAAGMMLSAAVCGLALPSIEYGGIFTAVIGIFLGTVCLILCDGKLPEPETENGAEKGAMLLLVAIAVHNFPEGMAAGVSFGTDSIESAISIVGQIALQNVPEGMIIIGPMLAAGISPIKTLLFAAFTGVIEIFGTFLGYYALGVVGAILPFTLSFAGGMMLYAVLREMIPKSCKTSRGLLSCIFGFLFMLVFDAIVS